MEDILLGREQTAQCHAVMLLIVNAAKCKTILPLCGHVPMMASRVCFCLWIIVNGTDEIISCALNNRRM